MKFLRDGIVTTGSFLGAWLWSISPAANFLGAALLGGAGALWFWWFVYRTPLSRLRIQCIALWLTP